MDAELLSADTLVALRGGPCTATIDGRTYAIGMHWLHLSEEVPHAATVRRQARAVADNPDRCCVRPWQAGYGWRRQGHRWGLPSLAAATALAVGGASWVAVTPLDGGGWWLGSCHDGLIDITGDRWLPDESAARNALFDVLSLRDPMRQIFCPEDWDVDGCQRFFLTTTRGTGLRHLSALGAWLPAIVRSHDGDEDGEENEDDTSQRRRVWLVSGFLAALALGVWLEWEEIWDYIVPPPPPINDAVAWTSGWNAPWVSAPPVADWLGACEAAFEEGNFSAPGWIRTKFRCEGDQAIEDFVPLSTTAILDDLSQSVAEGWSLVGGRSTAIPALVARPLVLAARPPEGLWQRVDVLRLVDQSVSPAWRADRIEAQIAETRDDAVQHIHFRGFPASRLVVTGAFCLEDCLGWAGSIPGAVVQKAVRDDAVNRGPWLVHMIFYHKD